MPRPTPEPVQKKGDKNYVSPTKEPPPLTAKEAADLEVFEDDLVGEVETPNDPYPDARSAEDILSDLNPKGLHAKLADLRANFGFIGKTGRNTGVGGGYGFVEATEVARRFVQEASARNLTMVPVDMRLEEPRPSASGKQVVYTLATMWRVTDADSGEFIEIPSFGQGADQADKALPKAQTNAMKYAILLLLQAAGDDPENDPGTDALENTPQGPGVNVGPSDVQGVRQGGRQTKATTVQLDEIRRHAKRLDLSPEAMGAIIGSALGGNAPEIDSEVPTSDQQSTVIKFLQGLSFDDAGRVVDTLSNADPE